MTALRNLGFETVGGSAGLADGWSVAEQSSAIDCARFTGAYDVDDFSVGWSTSPADTFVPNDVEGAVWDLTALPFGSEAETFLAGWGLSTFLDTVASAAAVVFTGSAGVESFTTGWDVGAYVEELVGLALDAAVFTGGNNEESFAVGWSGAGYTDTFDLGPATIEIAPLTNPGGSGLDSFDALDDVVVTVEPGTYLLRSPGYVTSGYPNDTPVKLLNAGDGGTIPEGLNEADVYYVITTDLTRFQLALEPSGTPVPVTGLGSGKTLMRIHPVKYWSGSTKPTTF